jgi:hypothetical protein
MLAAAWDNWGFSPRTVRARRKRRETDEANASAPVTSDPLAARQRIHPEVGTEGTREAVFLKRGADLRVPVANPSGRRGGPPNRRQVDLIDTGAKGQDVHQARAGPRALAHGDLGDAPGRTHFPAGCVTKVTNVVLLGPVSANTLHHASKPGLACSRRT